MTSPIARIPDAPRFRFVIGRLLARRLRGRAPSAFHILLIVVQPVVAKATAAIVIAP